MTNEQNTFIEEIANAAIANYPFYCILPSLTIAQAIKESGWGKSKLASVHHNYFGMKWTKTCGCDFVEYNTKEYLNSQYVTVKAKFRSYPTAIAGIEGYYKFISGYKRYANLIGEIDAYTACINIQKDGWATAPNYGESLYRDYVLKYDLQKYDDIVLGRSIETTAKIHQDSKSTINTYEVRRGDSLWSIAKHFYGNGIYYTLIKNANNIRNSNLIQPGQVLIIPMKED